MVDSKRRSLAKRLTGLTKATSAASLFRHRSSPDHSDGDAADDAAAPKPGAHLSTSLPPLPPFDETKVRAAGAAAGAAEAGRRESYGGRGVNDRDSDSDDAAGVPCGLPFQEVGSRMRAAFNGLRRANSKAAALESRRRMSRRRRSSERIMGLSGLSGLNSSDGSFGSSLPSVIEAPPVGGGNGGGGGKPMGYVQLRAANALSARAVDAGAAAGGWGDPLSKRMLEVAVKPNFCDVEIAGEDGAAARAPGFLLACHSPVFEDIFCPREGSKALYPRIASPSDPRRVRVDFASQSTLEALVHFCASRELPPALEAEEASGPDHVRTLSRLHLLGRLLRIPSLVDEAYRTARRVMNKSPSLVCAAFDECTLLMARADAEKNWGLGSTAGGTGGDLRAYALDYLRESPTVTIVGRSPGAVHLSAASIEALVRDQEIDADEYSMWRILNMWVKRAPGTEEEKVAVARSCASHIQLVLIDPLQLEYQIKKCGFVDPSDVDGALEEIKLMLENESPDDKERVIVEGAGDERINGVYVLADEEVGLANDEVMFLKEGDEVGDFCGGFGLFVWGDEWGISCSLEYFNLLYSCKVDVHKGHTRKKPPKWGWKCVGGAESAPTCTWKPGKEESTDSNKDGIAPALNSHNHEKMSATKKMSMNAHSHAGHTLKQSFTLSQMMALPEDEEWSKDDYRATPPDLNAMMHMSVDEGHDDEEAGYNVNYMSATMFCNSTDKITKDH